MIKVNGSKVSVSKEFKLTEKQKIKLKYLKGKAKNAYLMSLLGMKPNNISLLLLNRTLRVGGRDALAEKAASGVNALFREAMDNSGGIQHRPLGNTQDSNWIGVEIECLVPGEDDCDYCGGSGEETCCNCEGNGEVCLEDDNGNDYTVTCRDCGGSGTRDCAECDGSESTHDKIRRALRQNKITLCSVRGDGSLRGGHGMTPVEVTVLFNARHGFDKVHKVCKILNDMGAEVNASCGLHVHLDASSMKGHEALNLAHRFGRFLPVLSKLVPRSRTTNSYCKLSVSKLTGDRYYAVNLTSFDKHGTIEIRLHSGTTSADKIENWVNLLCAIRSLPQTPREPIDSFQDLIDILSLSDSMVEYFDRRFQKFNPESTSPDTEVNDDEVGGTDQLNGEVA